MVEGRGVPVGLAAAGANVNDFKLANETVKSIPIKRPRPSRHRPQHSYLDKGYDYDKARELAQEFHIASQDSFSRRGGRIDPALRPF
ncbi:MAG: hypothetical protein KA354_16680 [Phycisphaerae bacterium]|nr:hypothetical protein [Phycisphaerae bacterium]